MNREHTGVPSVLAPRAISLELTQIMAELSIPTRRLSHAIRHSLGAITSIALSHDEARLAVGDGTSVWVLNVADGACLYRFDHPQGVTSVAWNEDDERLATGSHDAVRIWDLASGTCVQALAHPDAVRCVYLSEDGDFLATGCQDGIARLFDLGTGTLVRSCTSPTRGPVLHVFLSEDLFWLLTENARGADLWHAQTGQHVRTFLADTTRPATQADTTRGLIASGVSDNAALIWNAETGEVLRVLEHPEPVHAAFLLSHRPRLLATACQDSDARLWDMQAGQCLTTFHGHIDAVTDVVLSEDGRKLFTGGEDRTAKMWDTGSGRCLRTYSGHESSIMSIALSADGRQLFVAGYDPVVRSYSLDTGRCAQRFVGHTGGVSFLSLTPDGSRLATSSRCVITIVVRLRITVS